MRDKSSIRFDEDVGLMVKTQEGDRSAYEKIYRRYFRAVVSFLARRTRHAQTCEDLAQEVFARVWRSRSHYRPLAPVQSYLLGVAANVLRESRTRNRGAVAMDGRSLETLEDPIHGSPLRQIQSAEQIQAVRAAVARLPARQRQALELVYLAELPPPEAARRLGCSVKTLYSHLCAARQRLRNLVRMSP